MSSENSRIDAKKIRISLKFNVDFPNAKIFNGAGLLWTFYSQSKKNLIISQNFWRGLNARVIFLSFAVDKDPAHAKQKDRSTFLENELVEKTQWCSLSLINRAAERN